MTRLDPTRGYITLQLGDVLLYQGKEVVLIEIVDLKYALIQEAPSGVPFKAALSQLEVPEGVVSSRKVLDYESYSVADRKEADRRFAIIQPLISMENRTERDVIAAAKASGLSKSKIYEMIRDYMDSRSITSLIPDKRGRKKGAKVIDVAVEAVIAEIIDRFHVTGQKRSGRKTFKRVQRECIRRDLKPPSENTVRNRISRVDAKYAATLREGRNKAKQDYQGVATGVPQSSTPLAFVQIDHTKVNLVVVDESHRLPIGRPWITLVIDVNTRAVLGVYLSLDDPSYVSVGAALANSMIPKKGYLKQLELEDVEWPVYGKATKYGADNGSDFRSNFLKATAKDYSFTIEWRPLDGTHFGGHIERLMGTFSNWMNELPGATWSSPKERGDYDSDANAALTLRELEQYIVRHICEIYHKEEHSGLGNGLTPLRAWEQGLLGTPSTAGIGLPPIPSNPDRVEIDFLPPVWRTLTRSGITYRTIPYFTDSLGPLLAAKVGSGGKGEKTLFRHDPRDITFIWVWDETDQVYLRIPIAVRSMPPMTMSEFQAIRKVRKKANEPYDVYSIAQHANKNDLLAEDAVRKTKKARRQAENRRRNKRKNDAYQGANPHDTEPQVAEDHVDTAGADILPFDQDVEL